jgi:glycerol-3-phosphate acyltransferase PlsY
MAITITGERPYGTAGYAMLERKSGECSVLKVRNIVLVAASYLLGGISTGYYLVKWRTGEDIRASGSGSSGARNVGRSLGTVAYIATAAGDMAKGAAIPAAVRAIGDPEDAAVASVAAVAGHVWPAQLDFRGGRGLTVAFGAVMATEPRIGIVSLAIAGSLLPLTKAFTPAGLIATSLAPLLAVGFRLRGSSVRSIVAMAAIVLYGHRHYLRRGGDGSDKETTT